MLTLGGKPLQLPILQGGMGVGVSLGGLAGAVAACGGMGCISTADAGYREPDFARDPAAANHRALTAEIQKAKAIAGGMGVVAINAMVATRDYAEAIRTARQRVEQGKSLSEAMQESPYFPKLLTEMTGVGEQSGNMEQTLTVVSDYFTNEVSLATDRLLAVMEPAITIALAVVTVILLLGVYLPMFSLYGSIG